ncbi:MAG: LPP20 family lipoprotein [Nitrospirae bacterium]|nr:LPP20 family lipoprotein [Nitrospirota bacterium]
MISNNTILSRLVGSGLAVAILVAATACGGAPSWVKKGSGPYNEKDTRVFYGVGSIVGVKNEPLAWEAAENRARAELIKNFETYSAYLMRDYAASTTAADFTKSAEEQNVERAIKTFASGTLSGVRPSERYKDEKTGTYYVLAKMSLKDMQDAIAQSKELNAQVRDFVRKNGERLFDRLEKEEEKRANAK